MAIWYCGSVQHAAVPQFAVDHAYSVGDFVRYLAAPSAGNERVWRCTTAGTSAGTEPSWNHNVGTTTNSGTAVFTEVTGNSAYGWSAPHARLNNAFKGSGWAVAGDTIYVASDHDYSLASSYVMQPIGSLAAPIKVISVNPSGSVPPVSADLQAGARESTTSSDIIVQQGSAYFWGVTFRASSGATSGNVAFRGFGGPNAIIFENGGLVLNNTSASSFIEIGSVDPAAVKFINTTLTFGSTSQYLDIGNGRLEWLNTPSNALLGGTYPTNLFSTTGSNQGAKLYVSGVDLSALGSGKNICSASMNGTSVDLVNCKLGASVTVAPTMTGSRAARINVVNCDSGATGYRQERHDYTGSLRTETTIVRTGGASDGIQPISWKVVTNANMTTQYPLESFPIAIWNSTTGSSKTATIEIITDNVTLKDDEIWLEAEYLSSSGSPIVSVASDFKADILATGANQTTSSVTWTTTGLSTPTKQKLEVTFTPQMAGYVRLMVKVAKASTTVYICPKVTIS